jgi:cytochrome c-type biogenesis protein CcmE
VPEDDGDVDGPGVRFVGLVNVGSANRDGSNLEEYFSLADFWNGDLAKFDG